MILKFSENGKKLDLVWRNYYLDCYMGGVILFDNHLCGCSQERSGYHSVDWKTGKTKYSSSLFASEIGNEN